jgi:hypothetical protein
MGIYTAEKADADAVVLRHEGEDDHTIEIHAGISGASAVGAFAPVPSWVLERVKEGKRYTISLSFSEWVTYPAPPAEAPAVPAWAVQPDPARLVPSATEVGQVDQKTGEEVTPPAAAAESEQEPAAASQAAQDGAEGSPADTETDQPAEASQAAPAAE